jgi:DNA-binding transcriptional LysR family regulator
MTFNQLQYFIEVVKNNNISKAAKKLFVSQPAISAALKELEKEFGVNLFIRYNNQLTLTDEGHFLYSKAKELIQHYEQLKDEMVGFIKNYEVLKIGVPPMLGTFLLPPIIEQFTKIHPYLEIQIVELGSKANKEAILNQDIILGLVVNKPEDLSSDLLCYHKVVDTTLLFTVNKEHPLSKKKILDFSEIGQTPLILMKDDSLQSELVRDSFEKANIKPNIKIRTNQLYTIKELLRRNNLAAFTFNQILENQDELIGIPLKEPINLEISLSWRKDAIFNEITKKFIEFMMDFHR